MKALLGSMGYFRDTINFDTTVNIVKGDQYRTTVTFDVKPGKVVRLTLSVDHRIIDGVVAGEFMTELKRLLEEPVLLLA